MALLLNYDSWWKTFIFCQFFDFLVKTYLASNLAKEEAAFNLSFCALAEAFFNFSKRFNAFVISLKMIDASDVAG